MNTVLLLIFGLIILGVGAEFLVKGASRLARSLGISSLVVGLTVVAYGTGAPELAVSVFSGLEGKSEIALGNVVGSNILNVLLILGLCAMITPLRVARQLVRRDVPFMIAASAAVLPLGADGRLGRLDGALLMLGLVVYTVRLIRQSRKAQQQTAESIDLPAAPRQRLFELLRVAAGLGLLVIGSRLFVEGATTAARHFGVSDLIIGLTIVAGGTSLPELATSVLAGLRGERDIAAGKIIGSNIFNILAVLGISSLVSPGGISVPDAAWYFDLPIMFVTALACLPIFFTGYTISRWEGGLFFAYYLVYVIYLFLAASHSPALILLRTSLLWFVLPLTAVTLSVIAVRALKRKEPL